MEQQQQVQDSSEKTSDDSKCFECPDELKKEREPLSDEFIKHLLTLYKAQNRIWDSDYEEKLFHFMNKFWDEHPLLKKHSFFIPHVSLREVMELQKFTYRKDKKEKEYISQLAKYHVDFLIAEKQSGEFLFAIEVQGESHNDDYQKKLDEFKRSLLLKEKIDLWEISNEICSDEDKLKEIFDNKLSKLLYEHKAKEGKCEDCGADLRLKRGIYGLFWGCPNWESHSSGKTIVNKKESTPSERRKAIAQQIFGKSPESLK